MGAVFGMFAGYYFWGPKIIGKSYNEQLAHIHFWTLFVGVIIKLAPLKCIYKLELYNNI
jgi:heme/copper-type cytochrome/quinol oxidase subunit 1